MGIDNPPFKRRYREIQHDSDSMSTDGKFIFSILAES